jgi:hypothetical protein
LQFFRFVRFGVCRLRKSGAQTGGPDCFEEVSSVDFVLSLFHRIGLLVSISGQFGGRFGHHFGYGYVLRAAGFGGAVIGGEQFGSYFGGYFCEKFSCSLAVS